MDESRSILIVSDDDLLPAEMQETLGELLVLKQVGGGAEKERCIPLRFEELRVHGPWDMRIPTDGYDCCIISLQMLADVISGAALEALLHRARSVLWLSDMSNRDGKQRRTNQVSLELLRPCSDADLRAAVGHLLGRIYPNRQVDDVGFLRSMLAEHQEIIEPILTADEYDLIHYPLVERICGPDVHSLQLLEQLADKGAFHREVSARLRLCDNCGDARLIYEERCQECQSLNFQMTPMIHHFACAHVGPVTEFGNGWERRCPKCFEVVADIGRDHECIGEQMQCSCGAQAPEPKVMARCLSCTAVQHPKQTNEHIIWSYRLTEKAEEIALPGSSPYEETPLREEQSGLFSRAVLEFEIEREHARCERNEQIYTVIALSVHNVEQMREHHGVLSNEYLDTLFAHCTRALRMQDLIGRWSMDTAVVLLPETREDNAIVVVDRLESNIQAACAHNLAPLPVVGMATQSLNEYFVDGKQLVQEAVAQAEREENSESVTINRGRGTDIHQASRTDSHDMPLVVFE